jgi:hypothetical protein
MIGDGEYYRGTEKMIPKFARDYMVAYRYATEGATTMRGDDVKAAEDFNAFQIFLQSQGLADAEVMKQYRYNNSIYNVTDAVRRDRKQLLDKFYLAVSTGDEQLRAESIQDIIRFNQRMGPRFSEAQIDRKGLIQSIRSRGNRSERTDRGLYMDDLTRQVAANLG